MMQFLPIKTRPLLPPKDDLFQIFEEFLPELHDGDILFITSKVVSIHQGRCVPRGSISKEALIEQEADTRVKSDVVPGKDIYLTMKNHILIPSAGIDESNANGHYILRPEHLSEITKQIFEYLCQRFGVQKLGIIISDSTNRLGKRGVVGIGMYAYGIAPLLDKRGAEDIFGRKLEISQINVVDALSAMAVYLMGEANECTPMVIGREIPNVEFTTDIAYETSIISPEQDLYKPLLTSFVTP
jgi:F420-0:gamma-glutamyl ligase